jgi:hypothetical protein
VCVCVRVRVCNAGWVSGWLGGGRAIWLVVRDWVPTNAPELNVLLRAVHWWVGKVSRGHTVEDAHVRAWCVRAGWGSDPRPPDSHPGSH